MNSESQNVVLIFPMTRTLGNLRPPLGILTIAAPLVARGINVKVIDQRVERDWCNILEGELKKNPLCIGISTMGNNQLIYCLETCRFIRKRSPVLIVLGGIHPTLAPVSTIESEYADIIVTGEGEFTFTEVVNALRNSKDLGSINSLAYKHDGAVKFTEKREQVDLNRLPRLPFHLVDLKKYEADQTWFNFKGKIILPFETSRGCPYKCGYCVLSVEKTKWRAMSAEKVIDEIELLVKTYKVNSFSFVDNNFFVDPKRAFKITELFIHKKLNIEWYAPIRADSCRKLDISYLRQLEKAGCRSLFVGLESGSNRILEIMGKGETADDILAANRKLAKTNILAHYGAILGYPYETLKDVQETYKIAMQLVRDNRNARISFNKLIVNPKTPVFEECAKKGFRRPEKIEEWCIKIDNSWEKSEDWMDDDVEKWAFNHKYFTEKVITYRNMSLFMGDLIFNIFTWLICLKIKYKWRHNFDRTLFFMVLPLYNSLRPIRGIFKRILPITRS